MDWNWLREEMTELRRDMSEMKVTLATQAQSIDHHIRRTDLLEQRVEQVAESVAPLKSHLEGLRGIGKALAVVATLVAVATGVAKLLGY
jgi:hypothetical protein